MWFNSHEKLQAKSRAIEDSKNFSASLKMMFSKRSSCKQNLSANAFGSNLSSLNPAVDAHILVPNFSGQATEPLLRTGRYYAGLIVTSVRFSAPRPVDAGVESSYIAELNVTYNNPMNQGDRTVTMPFYFVTDSSGDLLDCFMTSYIPVADTASLGAIPSTIEDLLCTQNAMQSGDTQPYIYLPQNKLCVVKPNSSSSVVRN